MAEPVTKSKKQLTKDRRVKKAERTSKMLEMARKGESQTKIAKTCEVDQKTVSYHMKKNGILVTHKIKRMLKEYYAQTEREEVSDEEWAKRTGVYPETIARLKKEIQPKSKVQTEQEAQRAERNARILEVARRGESQTKIAKAYGVNQSTVSSLMKRHGIMAADRIKIILKEYYAQTERKEVSDEELAKRTGVYPETIARLKQEIKAQVKQKKQERKTQKAERTAKMLEMARRGKKQTEIANIYGVDQSTISRLMDRHGILATDRIKIILKQYYAQTERQEVSDEEWAKRTGVYPETIARLKQEIQAEMQAKMQTEMQAEKQVKMQAKAQVEQEKQEQKTQMAERTTNPKTQEKNKKDSTTRFLELAKDLKDPRLISSELGFSMSKVDSWLSYYGIYDRETVVSLLDSKSDEEIAHKGKLTVSAVQRVREQEAAKNTPQAKEQRLAKQRVATNRRRRIEEPVFLSMARNFEPTRKIQGVLPNYTDFKIILQLRRHGIASRAEVERMLENTPEMSDEEVATRANGSITAIGKIRKEVEQREKIVEKVPEEKRKGIEFMLNGNSSSSYISYKMKLPENQVKAIEYKWRRDKTLMASNTAKRIDFNKAMNQIRFAAKTPLSGRNISVIINVEKLLALYPDFLTQKEYALLAHACIQSGNVLEGVEICQQHLGLADNTATSAMKRIIEVMESKSQEKEQKVLPTIEHDRED